MDNWRTIQEVESNAVFAKVKVGDDVAILQFDEEDWWTGIVDEVTTYSNRDTRFIERPTIGVTLHCNGKSRMFYEDCVERILFKD